MSLIIDLEDYVLGISEMPYYWGTPAGGGTEALKAQAVAARSYALAKQLSRGTAGSNSCQAWCHVRDTAVDQRYVGWGHGWDEWTDPVNATAGVVIAHPGAPTSQQGIVAGFYS
ncbi:MAG: SpoIID/LytB domain-containing protein, partial [Acidimicrobiia bacterium]